VTQCRYKGTYRSSDTSGTRNLDFAASPGANCHSEPDTHNGYIPNNTAPADYTAGSFRGSSTKELSSLGWVIGVTPLAVGSAAIVTGIVLVALDVGGTPRLGVHYGAGPVRVLPTPGGVIGTF
jgi:hypothetical protein